MADRTADYVITLGGDDAPLRALVNSFKASFKSAASDIEAQAAKIELFKNVEQQVTQASASFFKATDAAAKFRLQIAQIEGAGGTVGKELIAALAATEKQVATTSKEFNKQATQLDKLRASLTSAGVDTKNLAAEQTRLASALQAQQRADADRNAAAVLGIKLTKDQTAEIQRQYAAFNTLRANGLASSKDIAAAQAALTANVKATTATVKEGAVAAESFGSKLKTGIAGALLPYIGITAAIAGVVSGLKAAVEESRAFDQALAEIGAQTKASKEDVAALGEDVRVLAQELGIGLRDAFAGVKELLRSGVPKENVIEVLRLSAEAAKAAVVDVAVGVKASNLLLDAFGATVSELPGLLDKITRGFHEGGASLKDFAELGGPLLNVARATGQSFDELIAILTVMVDKSGNAGKSFADLTKILAKLDTLEVRAKLRGIGIESTNAVEIFQQLAAQGKTLGDVLGIDLTGAGAKSAASLAVLTSNAGELPEKLAAIKSSAGEVEKSVNALFDSPVARSQRFNAQLDQTSLAFGRLFGSGSKLQAFATNAIAGFNLLYLGVRPVATATNDVNDDIANLIVTMGGVPIPAEAVAASMRATAAATAEAAAQLEKTQIQIAGVTSQLTGLNAALLADAKALQDALTKDIADANARADAQIAALDRSKAAEAATAEATLAIKLKAAQDTFDLIVASEKKITEALNLAIKAREAAAQKSGENQKKIDADSAAARLQVVAQTLAAYQGLYGQLIALAQNAAARVQSFEEARVSIAQKVEDAIRGIRFDALTGLDQYVARMKEIDRLVSEGRKKAAEGDTAAAKQFFEQAITESKGLTRIVNENGIVVITTTQAQTDKLKALATIQKASNEAFGDQGDAAKDGAAKAIAAAQAVGAKILDLQGQYDTLKDTVAKGLALKVTTDEASIAAAFAKLDELTKPRTVVITVKTVNDQGAPVAAPEPGGIGLARGGPVGPVRRLAGGGPAFRTPSWFKVPGTGSGDTVPARLPVGSYVVRKKASRYYGDGIMGALARGKRVRGYAGGGNVLQIGDIAKRFFGSSRAPANLGGFSKDPELGPTIAQAYRVIFPLLERARALPRGSTGQNLSDFLAAVLDLIRNSESASAAHLLLDPIVESVNGIVAGINNALKFNIPIVMGAMSDRTNQNDDGTFTLEKISKQYAQLLKSNLPIRVFARGGSPGSTDSVPAMLTPGEWVIKPRAVDHYGPGFFHGINTMSIPRAFVANMMAPPMPASRFAEGGPVGNGPRTAFAGGPGNVERGPVNVNFTLDAGDLWSPENIRRNVFPVVRDAIRSGEIKVPTK